MNVTGPVVMIVFVVTFLTIVGAIVSYGALWLRERRGGRRLRQQIRAGESNGWLGERPLRTGVGMGGSRDSVFEGARRGGGGGGGGGGGDGGGGDDSLGGSRDGGRGEWERGREKDRDRDRKVIGDGSEKGAGGGNVQPAGRNFRPLVCFKEYVFSPGSDQLESDGPPSYLDSSGAIVTGENGQLSPSTSPPPSGLKLALATLSVSVVVLGLVALVFGGEAVLGPIAGQIYFHSKASAHAKAVESGGEFISQTSVQQVDETNQVQLALNGVGRKIFGSGEDASLKQSRDSGAGLESVVMTARKRLDFSGLKSKKPSLFVSPDLDINGDGKLQDGERLFVHARTPQFIIVSVDDNGTVNGLEWLRYVFKEHGIWGKATFFMTGNYLSGRPNYRGGPIDDKWQMLFKENFIGLHGTTHREGSLEWDDPRWLEELTTVHGEMTRRFKLPDDWTWEGYPWGSRAPFLIPNHSYYSAMINLDHPLLFDSSLVALPGAGQRYRDLPWPFTLDNKLPPQVMSVSGSKGANLSVIRPGERHLFSKVWEIPLYAWMLSDKNGKGSWHASMDYNIFLHHGCEGEGPNMTVVKDLIANLEAHYMGNRAPFHLGFHDSTFHSETAECQRRTFKTFFEAVDELQEDGLNIRYISMPELILWMSRGEEKEAAHTQANWDVLR